jgi:hypothetical protein
VSPRRRRGPPSRSSIRWLSAWDSRQQGAHDAEDVKAADQPAARAEALKGTVEQRLRVFDPSGDFGGVMSAA